MRQWCGRTLTLVLRRCHWLGITSLSDLIFISQGLCVTEAISNSWVQERAFHLSLLNSCDCKPMPAHTYYIRVLP